MLTEAAVNGKDLRPPANLYAPFENTSGRIVEITVGPARPAEGKARTMHVPIVVQTTGVARSRVDRGVRADHPDHRVFSQSAIPLPRMPCDLPLTNTPTWPRLPSAARSRSRPRSRRFFTAGFSVYAAIASKASATHNKLPLKKFRANGNGFTF